MRCSPSYTVVAVLLVSLMLPSAFSAQTYTVLMGFGQPDTGVTINAFYPETVTIHVGDTVHWIQNSNEIHTVTFPAGTEAPALIVPAAALGFPAEPGPLVFNPAAVNPSGAADGLYDGAAYANSGVMGNVAPLTREFDLTFTAEGAYDYNCLVHGIMMSGRVVVVAAGADIPSPYQTMIEGFQEMAESFAQVPALLEEAQAMIQPPVANPDGTVTHHVTIGHSDDGQIDLMRFFPSTLTVHPGDTVVWEMAAHNHAPHTVTFLNGQPRPVDPILVPRPSGPPLGYNNPAALFPQLPSADLTRSGIYNSGVIEPIPGTTFTLTIGAVEPGPLPYICLLHDIVGMKGELIVASQ
jgi:plastocyanin